MHEVIVVSNIGVMGDESEGGGGVMTIHQVIVGNIGNVCTTNSAVTAFDAYVMYKEQSRYGGRAYGESVVWFKDYEIHREYLGVKQGFGDDDVSMD